MKNTFNFTKSSIKEIVPPKDKDREYYKDTKEAGLILQITQKGKVTFYFRKKVDGSSKRFFIGHFPDLTPENARTEAIRIKNDIALGKNPEEEKNAIKNDITFGDMFNAFLNRYAKVHKKSWKFDEHEVNRFLKHWFNRKASTITNQEIRALHEKITVENGKTQANKILERIKAIYNKNIEFGWQYSNPSNGIKKNKEKSRDRFMQADELPRFFEAVAKEENETARDYILISLLTGARKSNVLAMQWKEINFTAKTWRIPDTKNGDPVTLPLSVKTLDILNKRKEVNDNLEKPNKFVFPGTGAAGHLADPKKAWKRILKAANIENLHIHDLRRTLGSWQAAIGSTTAIIGKSLGHKSQKATAIYERLNIDPIRDSVEKATDAMFKASNAIK